MLTKKSMPIGHLRPVGVVSEVNEPIKRAGKQPALTKGDLL
ncbi:hypothetical protein ACF052_06290 [Streptomyces pilosus]